MNKKISHSGNIITYGKYAVTIQDNYNHQYYCPYENLDTAIYNLITEPFVKIPVSFKINYNKTSGKTNYGPRYYAYDVILEYVF